MTREEHIAALEKYRDGIISGGISVPYDDLMIALDASITALRGPQADPETGLAPCGCGTPAICVTQTSITYDGKKKVKYSVKCTKNHVHTDWFDTVVQAVNYWHRAMGCPTK